MIMLVAGSCILNCVCGNGRVVVVVQDHEWQLVILVLLKALSVERLPALQPSLEGRAGVQSITSFLSRLSYTLEEFDALLETIMPVDV